MTEKRWPASEASALQALESFFDALNAKDEQAMYRNVNLPHVRIAGDGTAIYNTIADLRDSYMRDFSARAGADWDHTSLDSEEVIHSSENKVHVFIQFTRRDRSDNKIATHQSLWIMTCIDGHWGVQARSSFAP